MPPLERLLTKSKCYCHLFAQCFQTGLVQQHNLEKLKYAIKRLQGSQTGLVHIIRNRVTLLIKSHENVQENREVINWLVNDTGIFRFSKNEDIIDETQDLSTSKMIDKTH